MTGVRIVRTTESRLATLDLDDFVFGEVFSDHMFVMDYADGGWIWDGARIEPYGPLAIEPGVMALHYAQMVFEGLKAYRGVDGKIRLFRPDRNAERLNASCRRMCIPEIDPAKFVDALTALVATDRGWVPDRTGYALYIRPVVFSAEPHLEVRPSRRYRMVILASPVGAYFDAGGDGLSLKVEDEFARTAPHGGVGEAKTAANYATTFLAGTRAKDEGFDQVLWLDGGEHRYVEEAGLMNVFFKIGERVVTPALDGTVLPGVTRASAIDLLRESGTAVEERRVAIDEVTRAAGDGSLREIFVTGTAAVVTPVGRLDVKGIAIAPPDRGVTGWLRDQLTGLQYGRIEDRRGWTRVVV